MDRTQRDTQQVFCGQVMKRPRNPASLESLVIAAMRVRSIEAGLCIDCETCATCAALHGPAPRLRSKRKSAVANRNSRRKALVV